MKKTFAIAALGLGLILSGCSSAPPGPAASYTGKAVIEDSHRNSRKSGCKLSVKLPDGQKDTVSVGRRTTCDGWTKGRQITLTNGVLNK